MKHSKSALFLMELIITIFFFSLASTVCIQLFTKAHLLSKQTVNENEAVIHAQNLAECFLATEGDIPRIKALLEATSSESSKDTILLFFDEEWLACDETGAHYVASLIAHPEADGLIAADISVDVCNSDSSDAIYTLKVMHHIPERRGSFAYENN